MVNSKEAFKVVLDFLQREKGVHSKIAVQKCLFFINELERIIPRSFGFNSHGPFSPQVRDDAEDLEQLEEIRILETEYCKGPFFEITLSDADRQHIRHLAQEFCELVGNNFEFENLALYGSVLYSIKVLHKLGENYGPEAVAGELWAGFRSRFSEEAIKKAWRDIARRFRIEEMPTA
jgi:hypothetical protein